jgi:antitoxin MazE
LARTEVGRWGNSLAVRLPREIANRAKLTEGAAVDLEIESGHVVIRPRREAPSLDELLAGITPDNIPDEGISDGPRGRELI